MWAVDDRRNVQPKPESSLSLLNYDFYERSFEDPLTEPLELERDRRAQGINSLDEVPDSTWFVNRSTAGVLIQGFGQAGDLSVPNAFVR